MKGESRSVFRSSPPTRGFFARTPPWNSCTKRGTQAAVSQWYCDRKAEEGGYQWLLPLFVTSENLSEKPDFVATLAPDETYKEYNVRTLLPPAYAYGHARAVSGRDPQFRTWA